MGRPKVLISKAQLAGVLGLTPSRISQMVKRPDFPSRPDGKVNQAAAVQWYKDCGLADQAIKRGPKGKRRQVSGPEIWENPALNCGVAIAGDGELARRQLFRPGQAKRRKGGAPCRVIVYQARA
jgi:hypothetical protein